MQIAAIMKPMNRFLLPTDDLGTAREIMEDEDLQLGPVCAADGILIGTVDRPEVEQALEQSPASSATAFVEALMSQEPMSCTETDDVMIVARKAQERNRSQTAVINDQGGLVGVANLIPYQHAREPNVGTQYSALDNALDDTFPASDPMPPP